MIERREHYPMDSDEAMGLSPKANGVVYDIMCGSIPPVRGECCAMMGNMIVADGDSHKAQTFIIGVSNTDMIMTNAVEFIHSLMDEILTTLESAELMNVIVTMAKETIMMKLVKQMAEESEDNRND